MVQYGAMCFILNADRADRKRTGSGFPPCWPLGWTLESPQACRKLILSRAPHASRFRDGGRWFERAANGAECDWGRVLAWEPPHRVTFSWHLQADWSFDPNPERASEVEIRFNAESAGKTRVDLEHRGLQRHGEGWEQLRAAVDSAGGWTLILEQFAKVADA
jgi:uncharacterized protein YndB with AHSA1/START domain